MQKLFKSSTAKLKTGRRLRLRTILLIVNLAILVLPLGSIFFFRIYENQLVHETEVDLISQAAFIAQIYKREIHLAFPQDQPFGRELDPITPAKLQKNSAYYSPIRPQIDLAKRDTLARRPDGQMPEQPPESRLITIGAQLTKVMVEAQRTTLAGMKILDPDGTVIAGRYERGQSFAHVDEIRKALSGRYVSALRARVSDEPPPPLTSISRGTGVRVFIVLPVIDKNRLLGLVYMSRTPRNILKHLNEERDKVVLAGLTILTLTLALALFTSATISRPINELIGKTRRIKAGEASAIGPLKNPGTSEIDLLAQSFSSMAKALHDRSEYLREFATHVSHEFKTPLTAIGGAAELLQEHWSTMSDQDRQKFLHNITTDTDRMKRLVMRLLELAKADTLTPSQAQTDLFQALQNIKKRFESPDFEVQINAARSLGSVRIENENLASILGNMLENARQHGATCVSLKADTQKNHTALFILDNGHGISKANETRIFTPFFTTRRATGGTGLGLGIVRSLIEAHGGGLKLLPSQKDAPSSGAIFRLDLPLAAPNPTPEFR